jgi:hypothetical protein
MFIQSCTLAATRFIHDKAHLLYYYPVGGRDDTRRLHKLKASCLYDPGARVPGLPQLSPSCRHCPFITWHVVVWSLRIRGEDEL